MGEELMYLPSFTFRPNISHEPRWRSRYSDWAKGLTTEESWCDSLNWPEICLILQSGHTGSEAIQWVSVDVFLGGG
jgi:hypothetical protein